MEILFSTSLPQYYSLSIPGFIVEASGYAQLASIQFQEGDSDASNASPRIRMGKMSKHFDLLAENYHLKSESHLQDSNPSFTITV